MGALGEFTKKTIKDLIATDYPHLVNPAVVHAQITSEKQIEVTNEKTGDRETWNEYTLAILDCFGNIDNKFPPIPRVRSKQGFKRRSVVSVAFAYGDIAPTIIEEILYDGS